MKQRSLALMILGAALVLTSPSTSHAGVGKYLADRWHDFADIFTARVSAAKRGRSAGVMVRATVLAQAGIVYFNGQHAGLDRRAVGVWREKRLHAALGPFAWNEIEMRTQRGNEFAREDSEWAMSGERGIVRNGLYYDDGRREPLAVGVELQPGLLPGFEIRIAPLEALDFIAGWTTMDVLDDDVTSNEEPLDGMSAEELPEEPEMPDPPNAPTPPAVELTPGAAAESNPADAPAGDVPLP